jgi:hypothetical protein
VRLAEIALNEAYRNHSKAKEEFLNSMIVPMKTEKTNNECDLK